MPGENRRRDRVWIVVVLGASLLFFSCFADYGLAPFDEGVILEGIRLQSEGQLDPLRFTHYSAQFRFLSWLFPDGDPDLDVVRGVWVALRGASAALILLIASRLMPFGWALVPVTLFLALPGPLHKAIVPFALCLCLHAMLRFLESGGVARSCWLALSLAFAVAAHPYTGLPTLAGWVLTILLVPEARSAAGGSDGGSSARVAPWAIFAVTFALATLAMADYLWTAPPSRLVAQNLRLVGSILPGSMLFARQLLGSLGQVEPVLTLSLYLAVLPVLAAAHRVARPRSGSPGGRLEPAVVRCLVIVGLLNLSKWAVRLDLSHLLQNAAPLWVLVGFLLFRLVRRAGREPSSGLRVVPGPAVLGATLLSCWLACLLALGLTSTDPFVGGIGVRLGQETVALEHPHGDVQVPPDEAARLDLLRSAIQHSSRPDERILVCSSHQILYHLTGRRPALILPVFTFPESYVAYPVPELVEEIRRQGTRLIVFEDRPIVPLEAYRIARLAPELDRLIHDEYTLVRRVGEVEVRVRGRQRTAGTGEAGPEPTGQSAPGR